MKKWILLGLMTLVLIVVISGCVQQPDGFVGCPDDARICPDGTVVVRIPPDCEFAPCPTQEIVEDFNYTIGILADYVEPVGHIIVVDNKVYFDASIAKSTPCHDLEISYTVSRSSRDLIMISIRTIEPDPKLVCVQIIQPLIIDGSFTLNSENVDIILYYNGEILAQSLDIYNTQ